MEDRDYFELLYQHWAMTTGAKDKFYMPEEYTDHSGRWNVYAVAEDESRTLVASGMSEADSDFYTAVHGCLPDLIRRLGEAIDEADRLDEQKDELVNRVARLEMEADDLHAVIEARDARINELVDR